MKKYMFLSILIGFSFCFSACGPGYVAEEPTYVEGVRPIAPSSAHIWIDGGWGWNRHRHNYVHREGRWELPKNGRTYVQGHWDTNTRGRRWVGGRWQ